MTINMDNIRIAVIDDDAMLLKVFSSMLTRAGYHADFFNSSTSAEEAIYAHPGRYDLLVVDIMMPGEDGVAFGKKVRQILPKLPIMFMTGGVSPEKKEEALSLGRVAFLDKPFPLIDALKQQIMTFLDA